ncbi:hypothetical protein [Thalassotalea agarivorans]|uniref:Porin n=1 Tax=Thalassotalea agarivorans TaxID=349064 RepID=A0A1I0AVE9_THASX|nr:hypothetical protein [Thalassotalea agarivorans]SES98357.1 hypothetical protein SAMN05660429_00831 [Thalassotalea agarivorans]
MTIRKLSAIALAMLISFTAFSEDEKWEDDWGDDQWEDEVQSPWSYSGFLEAGQGLFIHDNIVASQSSLSELRARLDLNYSGDSFELTAKGDLLYDNVLEDTLWQTRELSFAASPFSALDVKLGRQVLTWGTGDYLFLNDLFPKDWQSFFAGRDDEYLKAPSDSLRLTSYYKSFTLDFAYTYKLAPDLYLNGERFAFYSPADGTNIAPGDAFIVDQTDDPQFSARLATSISGVEVALYGYKGFWTSPLGVNEQGIPYFPEMNSWGASALSPLGGGIFNVEYSFYNSVEDSNGSNPSIANSQSRFLTGYEFEAVKNLTLGLQYYVEFTHDYDNYIASHPNVAEAVDEYRHMLTTRLRYSAMQQKLTLNLFVFYSPSDKDAYFKPSVTYRYDDNVSLSAGANVFQGKQLHTFFGQHEDNSNVWLRARFNY